MLFNAVIASSIISFVAALPAPAPAPAPAQSVDWKTVDYSGVDWKTVDYSGVDWKTVSYDFSNVDWKTVNYGNNNAAATGTPKAAAATTATPVTTQAVATPAVAAPSSASSSSSTSAAPASATVGLITVRSGSSYQYAPVHACGGKLQVGGDSCSSYVPNVSGLDGIAPTNETSYVVNFEGASAGDAPLALNVAVAGGQTVYISNEGAATVSTPHSGATPDGAVTGPFTISQFSGNGLASLALNGKQDFVVCPDGGKNYLYSSSKTSRTDCSGVDVMASQLANAPTAYEWA